MTLPARGDVWLADLNPTRGREQAGRRPVLVVSDDRLNQGAAELVIVLPVTSTIRRLASHVLIVPPEAGIKNTSEILCEAVRSVSTDRLAARWGTVTPATMERVEDCLRMLLRL